MPLLGIQTQVRQGQFIKLQVRNYICQLQKEVIKTGPGFYLKKKKITVYYFLVIRKCIDTAEGWVWITKNGL